MNTSKRWVAWVDRDGVQDSEAQPYHGPDDDGGGVVARSDGTFYRGIGPTPEEAIDGAMRAWRLAQDAAAK